MHTTSADLYYVMWPQAMLGVQYVTLLFVPLYLCYCVLPEAV